MLFAYNSRGDKVVMVKLTDKCTPLYHNIAAVSYIIKFCYIRFLKNGRRVPLIYGMGNSRSNHVVTIYVHNWLPYMPYQQMFYYTSVSP